MKKQKHPSLRPGRKAADGAEGLKRYDVMLTAEVAQKAVRIGLGSLSVGLRKAVNEHGSGGKTADQE